MHVSRITVKLRSFFPSPLGGDPGFSGFQLSF